MNKAKAREIIEKELRDLNIDRDSKAAKMIFEGAIEFAEIASIKGLRKYIEEYSNTLPEAYFYI